MTLTIRAHGASYRIEDPGGHIGKALRTGKPYEGPFLEHVYQRDFPFQGLAVDAGAHVGNHSLWLAAVCGLKVAAFEPLSPCDVAANVAMNDLDVEVYPFGLSDRDTTAGNAGKGRLRGAGDIPVRTLDSFDLQDVCLLKVDVEGMEPEVLRGGLATIARWRPVIYAECWDGESEDRVREVIAPLGYVHTQTFGATPLLEWEPR